MARSFRCGREVVLCVLHRTEVPPGHNRLKKPLQSKSHIPKIMFLAVTALPRPEKGFDGKIGFFRVRDCNHKTEVQVPPEGRPIREGCRNGYRQVPGDDDTGGVPSGALEDAVGKRLRCQQDGASVHTGKQNVKKLNIAGESKNRRVKAKITVFTQPSQSPDTNINDLAIFPSMSRRFNKLQKHESVSDFDRLAANAQKTWNDFPTDVLAKAWATKTNELMAIIKANGGNDFKLPHAKDVEDLDWKALFEDREEENEKESLSD